MSILEDLNRALSTLGIPFETAAWSDHAPDKYIVITPLGDTLAMHGDNSPSGIVEEARISLFSKTNYSADKYRLIDLMLSHDFTVTYISYIGFETDTKYHHLGIEVEKYYEREAS